MSWDNSDGLKSNWQLYFSMKSIPSIPSQGIANCKFTIWKPYGIIYLEIWISIEVSPFDFLPVF